MIISVVDNIGNIKIQDLRRLISIFLNEYVDKDVVFPFVKSTDDALLLKLQEGKSYEAYCDGELVGFINSQLLSSGLERHAYINMMVFNPKFIANGVDSMLFEELEHYLISLDIQYITVDIPAPACKVVDWFIGKGFRKTLCSKRSDTSFYTYSLHKSLSDKSKWNSIFYCAYTFHLTKMQAMMRHEGDGEHSAIHRFVSSFKYRLKSYLYGPLQQMTLNKITKKQKARVVFFASCLSMWKYQFLYELMKDDDRYEPYIVLSPFVNYSLSQQKEDLRKLRDYFDKRATKYIDYDFSQPALDVRKVLNPDILFYPQPYLKCLNKKHRFNCFQDKLLAYYPYGFFTEKAAWVYNNQFLNIAWKLFYATDMHLTEAKKVAANKGRNVEVVGYPGADEFSLLEHKDPWKKGAHRKRIIWAPHFSINARLTSQSNFLWMADFMLQVAEEYSDKIQLAFKPHPRLKSELYKLESWGKAKTDSYYEKWATMENGQLETGGFIDLFYFSDAMVHDSASFTVDYHYTQKPVMFVSKHIEGHKMTLGNFGKKAIDMHYIGTNIEEIRSFIENVVLEGNDTMREERSNFYQKYLLPPNGKTAAQNTLNRMTEILFK